MSLSSGLVHHLFHFFLRSSPPAKLPSLFSPFTEILSLRQGMWTAISSRSHNPIKIFPFGPNSTELMIYGTVEYVFKERGTAKKDWAARAVMARGGAAVDGVGGGWKMEFYQVYLDTK